MDCSQKFGGSPSHKQTHLSWLTQPAGENMRLEFDQMFQAGSYMMSNAGALVFYRVSLSLKQRAPTGADHAPGVISILHQIDISFANLLRKPRFAKQRPRRNHSLQPVACLSRWAPELRSCGARTDRVDPDRCHLEGQGAYGPVEGSSPSGTNSVPLHGLVADTTACEDKRGCPVRLEEPGGQLGDENGCDDAPGGVLCVSIDSEPSLGLNMMDCVREIIQWCGLFEVLDSEF